MINWYDERIQSLSIWYERQICDESYERMKSRDESYERRRQSSRRKHRRRPRPRPPQKNKKQNKNWCASERVSRAKADRALVLDVESYTMRSDRWKTTVPHRRSDRMENNGSALHAVREWRARGGALIRCVANFSTLGQPQLPRTHHSTSLKSIRIFFFLAFLGNFCSRRLKIYLLGAVELHFY